MDVRRRGSFFGAIVGWTFIMLTLSLVVWWFVGALRTRAMISGYTAGGVATATLIPASGAYRGVEVRLPYGPNVSANPAQPLELVLTRLDGSRSRMDIDLLGQKCSMNLTGDEPLGPADTFDDDTMLKWLDASGLDTEDAAVRLEARDLNVVVIGVSATPYALVGASAMPLRAFKAPAATFLPAASSSQGIAGASFLYSLYSLVILAALGLVMWSIGVTVIVTRRLSLLRQHRLPGPAAVE